MAGESEATGLSAWLGNLSRAQRIAVVVAFSIFLVAFLFALSAVLFIASSRSIARIESFALLEDEVTVSEFVTFGSDTIAGDIIAPEAYPSTVAASTDGTLYTGSYATGEIWSIDSGGNPTSLPESAATIGSVAGLDVAEDGTLYILDGIDAVPETQDGAIVWRYVDGNFENVAEIPPQGDVAIGLPTALAVDALERVYVVDLANSRVLRILPDGTRDNWWRSDEADLNVGSVVGIAYHAASDSLFLTDAANNAIFEVPAASDNPAADAVLRFSPSENDTILNAPALNGLDIAPDGTIYAAVLGLNRVGRVDDESTMTYLAGNFRGSSDVVYATDTNRIFVSNWDQSSLVPQSFLFLQFDLVPRLPFSIDVIDFVSGN